MSQHIFTDLSANLRSGGDLTSILEALQSSHFGTSRPAYAVAGTIWAKNVPASSAIELYIFDGTSDILMGTVDLTGARFEAEGGNVLEEIATAEASGDASLDFTGFDASRYSSYLFRLEAIKPTASSAYLFVRTSNDSGASFDAGASDYTYLQGRGGSVQLADRFSVDYTLIGGGAGEGGLSGDLRVFAPHEALPTGMVSSATWMYPGSSSFYHDTAGGGRVAAEAVDAIRFYMSAGNIASGRITMYGERTLS